MRTASHRSGESGVVLLTTLLILMIIDGVDGRVLCRGQLRRARDRDRPRPDPGVRCRARGPREAHVGSGAAVRRPTSARTRTQILALNAKPSLRSTDSSSGSPAGTPVPATRCRSARSTAAATRCPRTSTAAISLAVRTKGMKGIITKYPITITARSTTGNSEVRLRRELQTVAVPVFQFGVFSETDLTFYAGDDFDFGGRVHTNGNLFLSNVYGHDADVHRSHHGGERDLPRAFLERRSRSRPISSPAT